jgi:hypothetical protein
VKRIPAVLAALLAIGTLAACDRDEPGDEAVAEPIVGAWRSRLQFSDGAFASIKDLEFLYAFNAGGTLTESSNYDGAPPVPPAYGVWRRVAQGEYEAKYLFYITRAPARFESLRDGGGWLPSGHGVFTERITLSADGNTFSSQIRYEVFDSLGAPAPGGGSATGRGERIRF